MPSLRQQQQKANPLKQSVHSTLIYPCEIIQVLRAYYRWSLSPYYPRDGWCSRPARFLHTSMRTFSFWKISHLVTITLNAAQIDFDLISGSQTLLRRRWKRRTSQERGARGSRGSRGSKNNHSSVRSSRAAGEKESEREREEQWR